MISIDDAVKLSGLKGKLPQGKGAPDTCAVVPVGYDAALYITIGQLVARADTVTVIHVAEDTRRIDVYSFSRDDDTIISRVVSRAPSWDSDKEDELYCGPAAPGRRDADAKARLEKVEKTIEALRKENMDRATNISYSIPLYQGDKAQAEELLGRPVEYVPITHLAPRGIGFLEWNNCQSLQWAGMTRGADALIFVTKRNIDPYGHERIMGTPVRFKDVDLPRVQECDEAKA